MPVKISGEKEMETVGARIKNLRIAKKLTLAELSKLTGLTIPGIFRIENGERRPNGLSLKKFADCFHVSTDYLLGREPLKEISIKDFTDDELIEELKQRLRR